MNLKMKRKNKSVELRLKGIIIISLNYNKKITKLKDIMRKFKKLNLKNNRLRGIYL